MDIDRQTTLNVGNELAGNATAVTLEDRLYDLGAGW